jgi:hypothetical protein
MTRYRIVCADGEHHLAYAGPYDEREARQLADLLDRGVLLGQRCHPHRVEEVPE